jgi:peptidoglycan/LPS O-acetylase OafA/YrhL
MALGYARSVTAETRRLGYQPVLDGIRCFGVVAVFCQHVWFPESSAGRAGVEAFFVLSGFLITTLLLEEHSRTGTISLGSFYLRRALRLLPLLYLVLLLMFVGMVAFGITGADRREYVDSLLATAFYVMNLYQWIFPGKPTAVGTEHFWSLGTEEQFYMVWPVVLIGMLIIFALAPDPRRSLAWATGALIVFCIVSRATLVHMGFAERELPVTYGDALLSGALVAILRQRGSIDMLARRRTLSRVISVAALATYVLACAWPLYDLPSLDRTALYELIFLIPALLLLLAALAPVGILPPILRMKPVVYVGKISYGIYVIHYPIFWFFLPHLFPQIGFAMRAIVTVVATLGIATASHRWYESYFIGLKRRLSRNVDARAEPAPAAA